MPHRASPACPDFFVIITTGSHFHSLCQEGIFYFLSSKLVLMYKSPVCCVLDIFWAGKIELKNSHTGPIKVWRACLKPLFFLKWQSSQLISQQYKTAVFTLGFFPFHIFCFFLKGLFYFPYWMCCGCHVYRRWP